MGKFSFIVIPDTQKLSGQHPDVFMKMTRWIADHAREWNVKAVLHLGDVVDHGSKNEAEYQHASEALSAIYEAGLPLLIAPGNHDYDEPIVSSSGPVPEDKRRALSMFNQHFGLHRFQDKPWFGGVHEHGKAENMYALLEAGGIPFLFLILEFGPRDEVLNWADQVIREHPNRKVIVVTHCYMYMYGERTKPGDSANPKKYASTTESNDGEDMWQKVLKHHPNVTAVFSGHHIPEPVCHWMDYGVHGNSVMQFFQNWQSTEYGGGGRLRIVECDPISGEITVRVFNPLTEQFESAPGYELSLLMD